MIYTIDQRTDFYRLKVHLRWLRTQLKIDNSLPLSIIQFQVAFLDAEANCVEWQWFAKVLLSPCSYVHHGSTMVSQTIPPEGSMVMRIQQRFPLLAFTHEISTDSLNLFMTLWTVDSERPHFFWLTILSQSFAQSGEPRSIIAYKD